MPNVLSPKDIVFRPDLWTKTVHTQNTHTHTLIVIKKVHMPTIHIIENESFKSIILFPENEESERKCMYMQLVDDPAKMLYNIEVFNIVSASENQCEMVKFLPY